MTRIEINADGRHVIVDHTGDLSYLLKQALETWQATEKAKPPRGFAPGGPIEGGGRTPRHPVFGHTDIRCTTVLCVCKPAGQ